MKRLNPVCRLRPAFENSPTALHDRCPEEALLRKVKRGARKIGLVINRVFHAKGSARRPGVDEQQCRQYPPRVSYGGLAFFYARVQHFGSVPVLMPSGHRSRARSLVLFHHSPIARLEYR